MPYETCESICSCTYTTGHLRVVDIQNGENGARGYGGGGRGRLYTYRYTVTTRMTCIKMGSDESHFNVSLIVKDKVTR